MSGATGVTAGFAVAVTVGIPDQRCSTSDTTPADFEHFAQSATEVIT